MSMILNGMYLLRRNWFMYNGLHVNFSLFSCDCDLLCCSPASCFREIEQEWVGEKLIPGSAKFLFWFWLAVVNDRLFSGLLQDR